MELRIGPTVYQTKTTLSLYFMVTLKVNIKKMQKKKVEKNKKLRVKTLKHELLWRETRIPIKQGECVQMERKLDWRISLKSQVMFIST